jgi:hypothetical protein
MRMIQPGHSQHARPVLFKGADVCYNVADRS